MLESVKIMIVFALWFIVFPMMQAVGNHVGIVIYLGSMLLLVNNNANEVHKYNTSVIKTVKTILGHTYVTFHILNVYVIGISPKIK